ncbi:MAG: hypothetical protein JXQ75_15445, partial [Phycisphaerae bacterium]|nr:hypothetical protein [Phycisphaerae bacterium]
MTLPAKRDDAHHEPIPAPFLPAKDAALRLGLNVDHLCRLCRDQYATAGLAKKIAGRWVIHPNADPRLLGLETWDGRDIRQ